MSEELGEVINRFADLSHELPPGQGPGEDGEEGTGPTADQIREMHEEEREDRYMRAQDVIVSTLRGCVPRMNFSNAYLAARCVKALRKEGLL